ncbi:NADH-cytochrome b5 reductase [Babesia ovata]|uniref:NADH-cytochrome b5 reductase n=1 Tax=Babesia ovata TaxID=189622 RepID=A0A2H6KCE9_9APIC|nr:NADH-cytochrome b5 reductase [Babesia ovata]GBE60665.1 NADH-cytochrome b5 reductase [Babesia ovata]
MDVCDNVVALSERYLAGEGFHVPSPKNIDTKLQLPLTLVRSVPVSPTAAVFVLQYPQELEEEFRSHVFAHYVLHGRHFEPSVEGYWNGIKSPVEEDNHVARKYTPIFVDADRREVHFLIRIYRCCPDYVDGGRLTRWLECVDPQGQILLNPWFTKYSLGKDGFIGPANGEPVEHRTLNIVAGGTGITPFVRFLIHNKKAHVKLLYCNKTLQEILLKPLIDQLRYRGNFEVRYLVTSEDPAVVDSFTPTKDDNIFFGKLSRKYIEDFFEREDSVTISCGPPGMMMTVKKITSELGLRTLL